MSKRFKNAIKFQHRKAGYKTAFYKKHGKGRRNTGRSSARNMSQMTNP